MARGSVVGKMPNSNTSKSSTASTGSTASKSGSATTGVDYKLGNGNVVTVSKDMAASMDKNRTDGVSGVIAGSEKTISKGTDYTRGNSQSGRETAYTFNDNGTTKTIYSGYTDYRDALNEAVKQGLIGSGATLSGAVSYGTGGDVTSQKGGSVNTNPSINSLTGSNAYMEALAHEAAANSKNNPQNNGQNLSNYYNAMNDFYTYYNNMTEGQKKVFDQQQAQKQTWDMYDALEELKNGYVPTKAVTTSNGEVMTPQQYQEYQKSLAEKELASQVGAQNAAFMTSNPYVEIAEKAQAGYDSQAEAIKELYAQMAQAQAQRLENNRESINKEYEDAAKQAYLNYQKQQFALPGQLAASGLTGGASETANISLNNSYGSNISDINKEKASANKELDNSITDVYNQYNLTAGEKLIANSQSAIDAYLSLMGNAAEYDYQAKRDAISDSRYENETAYDRYRDTISDSRYEEETAYSREMDKLNLAIQQAEAGDVSALKDMGYTSYAQAIADRNAYEAKLEQIELESAQVGLASDKLAYSKAMKGSSGSSGKAKPNLTLNQAKELIKEGIDTEEVRYAYKYYTGADPVYEEPDYYSNIDSILGGNRAQGRFDTANGLLNSAAYGVDNGWFTKDEYNKWAKARGYATL